MIQPTIQPIIQRQEGRFKAYQNISLFYQVWLAKKSQGTIVVTHGFGEHSEWYSRLAESMAQGGYDVFAYDLRGHGRSEGKRGVIENFTDLCEDQVSFLNYVRRQRQGKPLYVVAHSFGCLVTTRTLIEKGNIGVDKFAYSSPFFGVALKVPVVKELGARFLNQVFPNFPLYNEIKSEFLTHDRDLLPLYDPDPLRHSVITPRMYMSMLDCIQICFSQAQNITVPILVQMAGEDKVTDRYEAEKFFDMLGSKNKEKIIYENYYHEIYNEVGRERAFADLKKWLS